jgi:nifR3 family TIM-barrel protein
MKPFGVSLSVSEMISDRGLCYGNLKTKDYFKTSEADRPVSLQLFGSEASYAIKAIEILEREASYDLLDLNLGCPVRKVTATGAGSAWLRNPSALYVYARKICQVSHKPVTAKIRLGWDASSINVWEIAPLLEQAGVKMIAVHARTAKQAYAGSADYSAIKGLGEKLGVPLCVSGDIDSPAKALKAMETASASLAMVARGGLGHPNLIADIQKAIDGDAGPFPVPSVAQQAAWAEEFAKRLASFEGERGALLQLRGLLPHFFHGFPGYKKIRAEIATGKTSFGEIIALLEAIQERERL